MIIQRSKNPYGDKHDLFRTSRVEFQKGATILVGRNGAGKTTMLRYIQEHCKTKNIPFFLWDNYTEGGDHMKSLYLFEDDLQGLAQTMMASEGEQIAFNLGRQAKKIGIFRRDNLQSESIVILMDAVDSGLDAYNIKTVQEFINLILKDTPTQDVYIIMSANNYALVRNMPCLDVQSGQYVTFASYEDYEQFVSKQYEEEDDDKKEKPRQTRGRKPW